MSVVRQTRAKHVIRRKTKLDVIRQATAKYSKGKYTIQALVSATTETTTASALGGIVGWAGRGSQVPARDVGVATEAGRMISAEAYSTGERVSHSPTPGHVAVAETTYEVQPGVMIRGDLRRRYDVDVEENTVYSPSRGSQNDRVSIDVVNHER